MNKLTDVEIKGLILLFHKFERLDWLALTIWRTELPIYSNSFCFIGEFLF